MMAEVAAAAVAVVAVVVAYRVECTGCLSTSR